MVIDCGIKNSQLRALLRYNVQLTIVNTEYHFINEVFQKKYVGIFISNGPGNPINSQNVVCQLKELFSSDFILPVFGICYGHQLMVLVQAILSEK